VLPFSTSGCAIARQLTGGDDEPAPDAAADGPEADADETDAGCPISAGLTPVLDGTADMDEYPSTQQLELGAMLGSDAAAIVWDRENLYVTVTSNAFMGAYEPLHVYLETAGVLGGAAPSSGKEYGGLVAALPFPATHVIAVRRVSDSGSGGPYDGVYGVGDGWNAPALALDSTTYASADQRTLSVRVPWTALGGCPHAARLALHVVHGQVANEWKDLAPASHTPWQAPGGGYYEIDLTGDSAISAWTLR
jgi:hypothetical protein